MPPYATGSCLCGAITYTLASPPTYRYLCHCPSCKKSSGSAFMHNLAFPSSAFTLTSTSTSSDTSPLRTYSDANTKTGKPLQRFFCGECGCPVKIETDVNKGKVFLPAGLIDDVEVRDQVPPESENWSAQRVGWFEGVKAAVKGRKRRRG